MTKHVKEKAVRTTCPYCGVGCGIVASVDDAGEVTVCGDEEHPSNYGRLCSKGSALAETLDLDDRLLEPEIDGMQVEWASALDHVAGVFKKTIEKHGPDSVAFYVSGQLLTEDYYVANKLMKGFIGSANIDTNSRLCMASSVAGHMRAFGSDTVPGTFEDLEQANLIVLTGSNLAWCHPVLYQRIVAAKTKRPEMRIVVIDPRRTVTCDSAYLHLPLKPDTDVAIYLGLLHALQGSSVIDETYISDHTQGFAAALKRASEFDLVTTAELTGLDKADLQKFYHWVAETEKTVTVYSQGVNQSTTGTDKVNAIINTHLATGRIGRPGMGPFSVTGQPNAMGGREVGGLANQLAAHMKIENPEHRDLVQSFWRSPTIPKKPGLKAVDLFKAMSMGEIKAVWVIATNPVDSLPNASEVENALCSCPFVVVSDIVRTTDTTRHANVLLPATGWGEKDGTVTNSERRISRQRRFLRAPGNTRSDWWMITEVAHRMGWAEHFDYPDAATIFREHASMSAANNDGSRDFDIGAYSDISPEQYDAISPFQWPAARSRSPEGSDKRFFADGQFFTENGRATFVAVEHQRPENGAGLTLNTGRVRDHWHTMTRTGKSSRLSAHLAEPFVEINKSDAEQIGILDAELASVESVCGRVIIRTLITERQQEGSAFIPFHWTDQFTAKGRVNSLITSDIDPISGQPGFKSTPVQISPFGAKWYGFAVSQNRFRKPGADYWSSAKIDVGWRTELGGLSVPGDWTEFAETLFEQSYDAEKWVSYFDAAHGIYRFAIIDGKRLIGALFLDRRPVAVSRAWVSAQLGESVVDFDVLSGRANAGQPDPGAVVCACFGVGTNQILSSIRNDNCRTVTDVGKRVRAGTNCGSCIPEIQTLLGENILNG